MRRITKTCDLATAYKGWHDDIEATGKVHPKYNSSQGEYYWDIVMNLFSCQQGLCAYTELPLCAPEFWHANKWAAGKYSVPEGATPQVKGHLEHFDRALKTTKPWLWDNLFMVDSDINTKIKKNSAVDPVLKPDEADYNEFEKLEYNSSMHIFIPNSGLPEDVRERIKEMIIVLGINHPTIKHMRMSFLTRIMKQIEFGLETWEIPVEMFPTAFEMVKRERLAKPA
jgi:hypothetical protein